MFFKTTFVRKICLFLSSRYLFQPLKFRQRSYHPAIYFNVFDWLNDKFSVSYWAKFWYLSAWLPSWHHEDTLYRVLYWCNGTRSMARCYNWKRCIDILDSENKQSFVCWCICSRNIVFLLLIGLHSITCFWLLLAQKLLWWR